jgi:hypothetical protein
MTTKFLNPWAQGLEPETLALFREVSAAFADSVAARARALDPRRFERHTPERDEAMKEAYFVAFCRIWALEDKGSRTVSLNTLMKHLRAMDDLPLAETEAEAEAALASAS